VKVLGWTPTPGRAAGSFAGSGDFVGNFTDQTAGKTLTAGDFAAGADIVFPVAGSVGLGAVAAAKAAGAGKQIVWVDTDGCVNDAPDCSWFLASATKGVEPSVKAAVLAAATGKFKGGTYVGTLKNSGTGTTVDSKSVSAALKTELATLTKGIEAGTISVDPTTYPAS
jgi:basic membrane protein A